MSESFAIEAADGNGQQYHVTISPPDSDEADLTIEEWPAGEDPTAYDPLTNNTYHLTGIRAGGDVITCQTTSFFGSPRVTITLGAAGVTIAVSQILFAPGPVTLPLDAKMVALARAWLAAQNFPQVPDN